MPVSYTHLLGKTTGKIFLNGAPLEIPSPITAVRAGIVLASSQEDEEEILSLIHI